MDIIREILFTAAAIATVGDFIIEIWKEYEHRRMKQEDEK